MPSKSPPEGRNAYSSCTPPSLHSPPPSSRGVAPSGPPKWLPPPPPLTQVGWIAALPWNQAPTELRERPVEQLPGCSSDQHGVHAASEKLLVDGKEYLGVVKYSASFVADQRLSVTSGVAK